MWSVHVRCAASSAEPGAGGVRGVVVRVMLMRDASSGARCESPFRWADSACEVRWMVSATPFSVSCVVVDSSGVEGGDASSVGAIVVLKCAFPSNWIDCSVCCA